MAVGERKVLNKTAEWQTKDFSGYFTGFIKTMAWNPQETSAWEHWLAAKVSSKLSSPFPNVDRYIHVGAFIQNRLQLNHVCQRALLRSLLSPPLPIPKKVIGNVSL